VLIRRRRFRVGVPSLPAAPGFHKAPLPWALVLVLGGPVLGAVAVRYVLGPHGLGLDLFFCLQPVRLALCIPGAVLILACWRRRPVWFFVSALACETILVAEAVRYVPIKTGRTPGRISAPGERNPFVVLTQNVNLGEPEAWEDVLRLERPHVACFQEAYVNNLERWQDVATSLGYRYTCFQTLRKDAGMGSFICSRYPIEPLPPVETVSREGVVRRFPHVRVHTDSGGVDLFSVHLESAPRKFGVRQFLESWPLRYAQAADIAATVRNVDGPVIVCGDMNATPTERVLTPFHGVLRDAWLKAGRGLGATWPSFFPILRLDQIWYRGGLRPVEAHVYRSTWSDHDACVAVFFAPGNTKAGADRRPTGGSHED